MRNFKFGERVRLNKPPFAEGKVLKDSQDSCDVVFECNEVDWYNYAKQAISKEHLNSIESSTVRYNLLNIEDYSPYCGYDKCRFRNPRTIWSTVYDQFRCSCGWMSSFPADFIKRYKEKWS